MKPLIGGGKAQARANLATVTRALTPRLLAGVIDGRLTSFIASRWGLQGPRWIRPVSLVLRKPQAPLRIERQRTVHRPAAVGQMLLFNTQLQFNSATRTFATRALNSTGLHAGTTAVQRGRNVYLPGHPQKSIYMWSTQLHLDSGSARSRGSDTTRWIGAAQSIAAPRFVFAWSLQNRVPPRTGRPAVSTWRSVPAHGAGRPLQGLPPWQRFTTAILPPIAGSAFFFANGRQAALVRCIDRAWPAVPSLRSAQTYTAPPAATALQLLQAASTLHLRGRADAGHMYGHLICPSFPTLVVQSNGNQHQAINTVIASYAPIVGWGGTNCGGAARPLALTLAARTQHDSSAADTANARFHSSPSLDFAKPEAPLGRTMSEAIDRMGETFRREARAMAPAPAPPQVDIGRLTRQVYDQLERELRIEKERRGL